MSTSQRIQFVEIPVAGNGGVIWNRLHEEREDICAAMRKDYKPGRLDDHLETNNGDRQTQFWHLELLQSRLRKIDEALDRLMSGAYGICAVCAKPIDSSELDLDPAIGFCSECRKSSQAQSCTDEDKQVPQVEEPTIPEFSLESLSEFDTILLQTHNSHYRFLLLDPKNGRALAQGGKFLSEPQEVMVTGSKRGSTFKIGSLTVGSHLEMWLGDEIIVTSQIDSIQIEHATSSNSLDSIMVAEQMV